MSKHVLITGGAGFLGSYLCDHYVENNYTVICVDNLSTGSRKNIEHLVGHENFRFIEHDIVEQPTKEILDNYYDIVINMASPASPPQYQRLAIETLEVGSIGTKHMLELARRDNARFFQASTSEVYGDPEVHPQVESYKGSVNCYGPRSMYDESKRYAEALIYVYKQKYGVSTAVARFFNTYGPRMDANDGRVVSNFIVQALQGKDITIYGDGSQTRSFCYVDDLVRAIVALIKSGEEGPINLGNPGEFTVKELAEKILKLTGSNSKITFFPLPGDDPLQRKPDISLAKKSLNWQPEITLEKGLEKTILYFENQLKD
jgi:nucleoside-diphosphate-sugar epimerase